MMFVWANTDCSSDGGTPTMSQTICSGRSAAISLTKSHSPLLSTASITPDARTCTWSSSWFSCLGPKPELTRPRSFLCRGSSMLMIDPRNSASSWGMSPMLVPPRPETNSSGWRLACMTSAYRVSAQ